MHCTSCYLLCLDAEAGAAAVEQQESGSLLAADASLLLLLQQQESTCSSCRTSTDSRGHRMLTHADA